MIFDFLSDKKALFPASCHTELRAQVNRVRSVSMISGSLVGNSRSQSSGVSARVYKNGVWGFSSAAEMNSESAIGVISAASDNAAFMDRRLSFGKGPLAPAKQGFYKVAEDIKDIPQEHYIAFLKELDAYIEKNFKNLISRSLSIREDSREKLLITSDGAFSHTISPRSYVYIMMSAESKDGTPVELFVPIGKSGTFDKNFPSHEAAFAEADSLYEKLMQKREGVWAEAGERDIILGGDLAGMLAHEAVGHTVEADLVAGGSVAAHLLGCEVASPLVSMTDFASEAFGEETPLPVYVDDEGTEALDAPLIKDGVLVGYMNNRESAEKYGMEAKGNARAYTFSDEPLIRMRNTAIHPGESKLEDMIASVEDGYYLVDTNNGQADTTGEFMFGVCMGYEIKKGKIGRAILDTTLSGVAFDMLKSVDMVSNTMHWSSAGVCGKKQPMPVGMGGPELKCRATIGGR